MIARAFAAFASEVAGLVNVEAMLAGRQLRKKGLDGNSIFRSSEDDMPSYLVGSFREKGDRALSFCGIVHDCKHILRLVLVNAIEPILSVEQLFF
jgi:hypothetical protein